MKTRKHFNLLNKIFLRFERRQNKILKQIMPAKIDSSVFNFRQNRTMPHTLSSMGWELINLKDETVDFGIK